MAIGSDTRRLLKKYSRPPPVLSHGYSGCHGPSFGVPARQRGSERRRHSFRYDEEIQQRGHRAKRGRGRATATLQRVRSCPARRWAQGGCAVDPASLLLAVACYASSSFVLRLWLRCRVRHCTTPVIMSATLSDRAQAPGHPRRQAWVARPAVLLQQPSWLTPSSVRSRRVGCYGRPCSGKSPPLIRTLRDGPAIFRLRRSNRYRKRPCRSSARARR